MQWRPSGFWGWLTAATALGTVVRLVWLTQTWNDPIGFDDAFFYHHQANLLAEGEGYVSPFTFRASGIEVPAAEHPPLYPLYLFAFSLLGATSIGWHQLATVLLGVGTVTLIGLAGRELGGDRVGIVAAVIAALYPHLWYQDAIVWSEASSQATVALFAWLALRYRKRPTGANLAIVGVAAGLAALTRTELVLLLPLGVLPLALTGAPTARIGRLRGAAVGVGAGVLVLAPWVGFNVTRFDQLTTLSSNTGTTLATANCDAAWYGPTTGYWNFACAAEALADAPPGSDPSELDAHARGKALDYISEHRSRLPVVLAARVTHTFGILPFDEQVAYGRADGRPLGVAGAGIPTWYLAAGLAVVGGVALGRERRPLLPAVAPIVVMVACVLVTYGNIRFRATAEPAVVVLAAVGACTVVDRFRPGASRAGPAPGRPAPPPPR